MHISTRRNIALDLVQRGLITQSEAAHLLGESRQAFSYLARNINAPAARAAYVENLWRDEIARPAKKVKRKLTRRTQDEAMAARDR